MTYSMEITEHADTLEDAFAVCDRFFGDRSPQEFGGTIATYWVDETYDRYEIIASIRFPTADQAMLWKLAHGGT